MQQQHKRLQSEHKKTCVALEAQCAVNVKVSLLNSDTEFVVQNQSFNDMHLNSLELRLQEKAKKKKHFSSEPEFQARF